jgi:hypothetical protein
MALVSGIRDELQAAIEARRELGPAHEPELVDAFLDRIERRLDERRAPPPPARRTDASPVLAMVSLGTAIPLTAIALSNGGLLAVAIVWIGIVLVNFAYARR